MNKPTTPPYAASADKLYTHAVTLDLGTWAYALDDPPGVYGPGWYPFHELVTEPQPVRGSVTHVTQPVPTGKTRPRTVRISPDVQFYSWGNEYVLLSPNDHLVTARLNLLVRRSMVRRVDVRIDLRDQRVTVPEACPALLKITAGVKGRRILDFLNAARTERRRGMKTPDRVLHPGLRTIADKHQ
jgi:hypothetical protein